MMKQNILSIVAMLAFLPGHIFGQDNFETVLAKVGFKFDCYFTLEDRMQNDWFPISSRYSATKINDKAKTLEEWLETFNKEYNKKYRVFKNKQNPAILHLVDRRLEEDDDYILKKQVDFEFAGTINDLVSALEKKLGGKISEKQKRLSWEHVVYDQTTKVTIPSKQLELRDLLTNHVPLSEYQRLIWITETSARKKEPFANLQYCGPATGWSPTFGELGELKLDLGEPAFRKIKDLEEWVPKAIEFIDTRMKKNEPLQVRWAMFLLGKSKAKEGIPVLVQYVDYRYTTCGILEESYPAVKALRQIGKPARNACVEEMRKEKNELRLELLSQVVLGIAGPKTTQDIFDAEMRIVKDAEQQARIKAALKKCLGEKK